MTRITFVQGDITKQQVDAIVNAANPTLLGGGGVDGAIHAAAGPMLLAECRKLGGCMTGEAKITKAYELPAAHVIHTVGPIFRIERKGAAQLLAACYKSCLDLAAKFKLKTIAFPSISTGAYGYPLHEAADVAVRAVKSWLMDYPGSLTEIRFVLFSQEAFDVYSSRA
jgi:O-acetyl-ADP-ribose deacetylase (regulator of RNase III)